MREAILIFTDVRVIDLIRLGKAIDLESMAPGEDWIALGHFSQMHISKLKPGPNGGVDLHEVRNHNQILSSDYKEGYAHPVYLLNTFNDADKESLQAFWNLPSAFLLVTRVHAALRGQQAFEESVKTCLNAYDANDKNHIDHFSDKSSDHESPGCDVVYCTYRTLEFSDIIVLAKSDSAESLLQVIGKLYYLKSVGDIYSYFGIHPDEYSGKRAKSEPGDRIPYVMTRFAVRNAVKTRNYFDLLQDEANPDIKEFLSEPLMVTGTEDLKLVMKDMSSRRLCEVLRTLLPNTLKKDETNKLFREAIDDATTRLSIQEKDLSDRGGSRNAPEKALSQKYHALYDRYYALYSHLTPPYPDWLRPGNELLKSLKRISDDCTMYHLCYTLLDGVKTMVRYAEEIIENKIPADDIRVTECMLQTIISSMASFEEQMIRVEGELVHHPETRPLLFDIPVNLIEFYLYFSKLCLNYFRQREPKLGGSACRFLIIPTLCETITVKHIEEESSEADPMLLFIEIPLHMMYDAREAVCKLVHEAGHFGGEDTRERKLRAKTISAGVGAYVLACQNRARNTKRMQTLGMMLLQKIPEEERLYQERLTPAMENVTIDLLNKMNSDAAYPGLEKDSVVGFIHELADLHKEAYADLAMVELLNLELGEYCEMLFKDISKEDITRYSAAVERAGIVIETVAPKWADLHLDDNNVIGEVAKYISWLNNDEARGYYSDENPSFHPPASVICAQYYLQCCYEKMKNYDSDENNREVVERIQDYFEDFGRKCELASVKFYDMLEKLRE